MGDSCICCSLCKKKLTGQLSSVYTDKGQIPPFSLMSRCPGISGYYLLDHPGLDIFDVNTFSVKGKVKYFPDYLYDRLVDLNPSCADRFEQFKLDRRKYAEDRTLNELWQTDLSFEELLAVKEAGFDRKTSSLLRPLE